MEKGKPTPPTVEEFTFKTDRTTGITLPVREIHIDPEEQPYYDCCDLLLHPRGDVLDRLPDDPLSIMLSGLSYSLPFAKSILGGEHPFITELEEASPGICARFIPVYLRMITDTLCHHPIRKRDGRPLTPQEALVSALKYSVAVTDRYSTVLAVLSLTMSKDHPKNEQTTLIPFDYQIGNNVKTIKLHRTMWYFRAKRKFFGELPAFGFRLSDIPFDFILLHPDPSSYLEKLRHQGIFELLSGFLDGRYYLPGQIREGFHHLDYVLLHEVEPGVDNSVTHPNNDTLDCGSGICIPTNESFWLTHGQVLTPQRENYLAFPHELRHVIDDFLYPWGPVHENIFTERRAMQEEVDTAAHMNWQNDTYIRETLGQELAINDDLLLHGWSERGFEHNDVGNMEATISPLAQALHHPNGAFLLEQTKKFLEGYLR